MNYGEFREFSNNKTSKPKTNEFRVGFFSLKDDGDEALVRFYGCDNPKDDIEVVPVHTIKVDDKYRKIKCLRTGKESLDTCPLCASQNKLANKIYVKLIEYVKNEDGTVEPKARVWERPCKLSEKFISYVNDGYVISDTLFKVRRVGEKGSINTTYDINPANPAIYKNEMYPKDFKDLENFNASGNSYMVKTFDEINEFLSTGEFPKKESNSGAINIVSNETRKVEEDVPFAPKQEVREEPKAQEENNYSSRPRRYNF